MNLYLIGYRGCGKSTVTPLVAQRLNREFVDTDEVIVQHAGQSIAEIFTKYGEAEFRRLETDAVTAIDRAQQLVVSLGGGAILAETNRQWMKANGKTVWLTADPEVLWARINNDESSSATRPDLTDDGGLAEVRNVLAQRTELYDGCADYTINVADSSPKQVAESIACWWQTVDKKKV